MPNGEFEKLLVEAIDESFYSLGESPKQAILFHLENTFKIDKQKIPDKIDSFDNALKKIFGPGADFLEALIIKKLGEKADAFFKSLPTDEARFTETILTIKRMMEK
jgi:uncharacterized protein YaaN involved in tellurite resistance